MAKTCNVQPSYKNNSLVPAQFLRGEIGDGECIIAEDSYYVASVPAGAIILGAKVLMTNSDGETAKVTIQIGEDNCKVCSIEGVEVESGKVTCVPCEPCTIVPMQSILKLTVDEYAETNEGGVLVLLELILPNNGWCTTPEYKLETSTVLHPACPTTGCTTESCPDK